MGLATHRVVVRLPLDREALVIEWGVQCDHPRCIARVYATAPTDREARDKALARAAAEGWLIKPDRFIRQSDDLCPAHRDPK